MIWVKTKSAIITITNSISVMKIIIMGKVDMMKVIQMDHMGNDLVNYLNFDEELKMSISKISKVLMILAPMTMMKMMMDLKTTIPLIKKNRTKQ